MQHFRTGEPFLIDRRKTLLRIDHEKNEIAFSASRELCGRARTSCVQLRFARPTIPPVSQTTNGFRVSRSWPRCDRA